MHVCHDVGACMQAFTIACNPPSSNVQKLLPALGESGVSQYRRCGVPYKDSPSGAVMQEKPTNPNNAKPQHRHVPESRLELPETASTSMSTLTPGWPATCCTNPTLILRPLQIRQAFVVKPVLGSSGSWSVSSSDSPDEGLATFMGLCRLP